MNVWLNCQKFVNLVCVCLRSVFSQESQQEQSRRKVAKISRQNSAKFADRTTELALQFVETAERSNFRESKVEARNIVARKFKIIPKCVTSISICLCSAFSQFQNPVNFQTERIWRKIRENLELWKTIVKRTKTTVRQL